MYICVYTYVVLLLGKSVSLYEWRYRSKSTTALVLVGRLRQKSTAEVGPHGTPHKVVVPINATAGVNEGCACHLAGTAKLQSILVHLMASVD